MLEFMGLSSKALGVHCNDDTKLVLKHRACE